uniref:Probable RNA-binding protein EIF1AD n=1 Tax=Syphacia muris TaxID=451379 RepID=A0A0N5ADS7_9BILA
MSIATKRRIVTRMMETELFLPEDGDKVAMILASRGNNLHEVEDEDGVKYLVSMPRKFRKAIWVKRGQFVIIHPIEEGVKVKAEISHILDDENVLFIREKQLWPKRFEQFAQRMTRDAKRHQDKPGVVKHEVIDSDMLPPSDTDEDEEDEDSGCSEEEHSDEDGSNDEDDSNDEGSDDDELPFVTHNPNRQR